MTDPGDHLKRDYFRILANKNPSDTVLEERLHPWVKVDQAGRPLPPKSLSILVGLTLKLDFLCIRVNVVENIWTFWFVFRIFCVASLERFVLVGTGRNVKISWKIWPK